MTNTFWKPQTKLEFPLVCGATLSLVGATNLFLDLQHIKKKNTQENKTKQTKQKNTIKMRTCCLVPPEKLNPGKSPK